MTSNLHYALRTASDQMFHCPHKSLAALFSHSYTRLSVIKWSSTLHTDNTLQLSHKLLLQLHQGH